MGRIDHSPVFIVRRIDVAGPAPVLPGFSVFVLKP